MKLYLDGCSFTYGTGLERTETLAHLFCEIGYNVTNLSRPGKSNQAIALDSYNHLRDCDVAVIGWTFCSRWYLRYHKQDFDLLPSREFIELPHTDIDSGNMELSYQQLHKSFYSLFDITHWNETSNMVIDTTHSYATLLNKKVLFFSWEPRQVTASVYYPHITASMRQPCGHLTADGTTYLFNNLVNLLET